MNDHLASCKYIYVYLHEVPQEQELVVDDFQISSFQSVAPTTSPTPGATEEQAVETQAPSTSPTQMPTVSILTSCPLEDSIATEIPSGPVKLARSSTLCVLTKAIPDVDGVTLSGVSPVALSYDGGDWEKAAGDFATRLLYGQEFGDYTDGTQITLPDLTDGGKYYLTSYSPAEPTGDEKVARFLESATFGPTMADIKSFNGTLTHEAARQWIVGQMDLPATSHREFFRKRVNSRVRRAKLTSVLTHMHLYRLSNIMPLFFLSTSAYQPCWNRHKQPSLRSSIKVAQVCILKERRRPWSIQPSYV